METKNKITKEAESLVKTLNEYALTLKPELGDIEKRKSEIESILDSANLAQDRLLNFNPTINGDFQCPFCWIHNGKQTPIVPYSSDSDNIDIFRCRTCGFKVAVPID